MQAKGNTIVLKPVHRIFMLFFIFAEHIGFIWGMILYINYNSIRIPFVDYPSVIPPETTPPPATTHYAKNAALYALFWLQHIVMATIKYKLALFKNNKVFVLYERYIYNTVSALTLWLIYSNLQPTYEQVFTIPRFVCIPLTILGTYFLLRGNIELGDKVLMPYKLEQILSAKSIAFSPYDRQDMVGIKNDGLYAYLRHPAQSGMLALLMFANGVYTVDKLINVIVTGGGIIYGVLLQEKRMQVQFKDYKDYMQKVKARFIPYLHFLSL